MTDLVTIDLDVERLTVVRLRAKWETAQAEMAAALEYAAIHKASPGDSYWLAERRARDRYRAAVNFVEMLEEAHRDAVKKSRPA